MKYKTNKIITPKPFYQIGFGCSNRSFYNVVNEVYSLIDEGDDDLKDSIEILRDYEGDLEGIRIYDKNFSKIILKHYGIVEDIGDMNLVLNIW